MRMTDGNYEEIDMPKNNLTGDCMEQLSIDALTKLYPESAPLTYSPIKEVKYLPVEAVNHPSDYQGNNYECIDVMLDNYGKEQTLSWIKLNIFKYIFRMDKKNGLEDMEKIAWYANKYIEIAKATKN